jgi:hypothetical protein
LVIEDVVITAEVPTSSNRWLHGLYLTNARMCEVSQLTCQGAASTGSAIELLGATSEISIDRSYLTNGYNGVRVRGVSDNIKVTNTRIHDCEYGFLRDEFGLTTGVRINGCRITASRFAVWMYNSSLVQIAENTFRNSAALANVDYRAVLLASDAPFASNNVIICDNLFIADRNTGNTHGGIICDRVVRGHITDNIITNGNNSGVGVEFTIATRDMNLNENWIVGYLTPFILGHPSNLASGNRT